MTTLRRMLLPWAALALAACATDAKQGEQAAASPPATPPVIEVRTTEYAFQGPDTVPAGLVTLRMLAGTGELHHVQVMRFDDGHTLEEFLGTPMTPGTPFPAWAHFLGGPNGADPGRSSEVTMHLLPGSYAFICTIPAADGMPHVAKGMLKPFVVTGAASAPSKPASDALVTITAGGYELAAPITAGRRALLVENTADAPHETVIVRLADGKSATDVVDWVLGGMQGPPPASGVGGTVGLGRNEWNVAHVELTPGQYALLDFFPGPDGRPNAAHGMVKQFEVK